MRAGLVGGGARTQDSYTKGRDQRAQVDLRKSGGGVFEITVDGRLAYSKKATGRFPTDDEILATLN
jgi:selT/selW/selH-like putative selenoprotein